MHNIKAAGMPARSGDRDEMYRAVADAPPRFPSERSIRRADLNGSGHHGVLGGRAAMALLGVLALDERDVNFGAVDEHQLALTVSEYGRRRPQEQIIDIELLIKSD